MDSSAAKSKGDRRGVGTNRHIQAKYLWLQDKVFAKELVVDKVKGEFNDEGAD